MTDRSLKGIPAASPSASGPAGALFEGQVGAHYLLTLLAEADPRGLPGVVPERVELQRAGEGHPLDDVVVQGKTRTGSPAVLEVQVKRTITFAPADPVFKDVSRAGLPDARCQQSEPSIRRCDGAQLVQDHRRLPGRSSMGARARYGRYLCRAHKSKERRQ